MEDKLSKKTYVIFGLSSVVVILLGVIVKWPILGLLDNDLESSDKSNHFFHETLLLAAGLLYLLYVILIMTFGGFRNKSFNPTHLYVLFPIVSVIIFSFINLTGGITNSPFSSLYGALMTLTLLIKEHKNAVYYSGGIIVVCIIFNVAIQDMDFANKIDTHTTKYRIIYGAVTILLLAFISTVDYLSKNVNEIKFLKNFFSDSI